VAGKPLSLEEKARVARRAYQEQMDLYLNGTNPKKFFTKLGISSGTNAVLGEFPHIAYIEFVDATNFKWTCQGALVARNLVVTTGESFLFILK
jgi:hypothetical protein